jgi:hypothetical protein
MMLFFIYWSVVLDPATWWPNSDQGALVPLQRDQDQVQGRSSPAGMKERVG